MLRRSPGFIRGRSDKVPERLQLLRVDTDLKLFFKFPCKADIRRLFSFELAAGLHEHIRVLLAHDSHTALTVKHNGRGDSDDWRILRHGNRL